jgi:uridine kinase
VICVTGLSSSGKPTFIKRLTVQLLVNGVRAIGLSLDDYYQDRELTVRDAEGDYDYEAVEALELNLLKRDLGRIFAGETVKTARYDFPTGKSVPGGGPEITLRGSDVLVLEGIHGLNPRLIGDLLERENIFRIFLQPMTSLPFDRMNRVNVSDVRLIRRIVRDRHTRGAPAAANILRWPKVRAGERAHIFPFLAQADVLFDSSLVYELGVIKVFADRYLLEVPHDHPAFVTAHRLRQLLAALFVFDVFELLEVEWRVGPSKQGACLGVITLGVELENVGDSHGKRRVDVDRHTRNFASLTKLFSTCRSALARVRGQTRG